MQAGAAVFVSRFDEVLGIVRNAICSGRRRDVEVCVMSLVRTVRPLLCRRHGYRASSIKDRFIGQEVSAQRVCSRSTIIAP